MSDKRLYKSSANYMLCGVCGGIAEYFNIDPTLVRLGWVLAWPVWEAAGSWPTLWQLLSFPTDFLYKSVESGPYSK